MMSFPVRRFLLLFLLLLTPLAADPATNTPAGQASRDAAGDISDALETMGNALEPAAPAWDAMDAKIGAYDTQYSTQPKGIHYVVMLRKQELNVLKHWGDQARYAALIAKLSSDKRPEVTDMLAMLDSLKTKPMEMHYNALDGTKIDLASLRGKVVLVDFWATWCPPCREEVPDVVATYGKYHAQGFEIVGVSLDKDKQKLLTFIQTHGMTWPQYFDGKGWDNAVSKSFGIDSIPAMWLLGKDGKVITMDASVGLADQVKMALAQ